jgi:hypothetical protein
MKKPSAHFTLSHTGKLSFAKKEVEFLRSHTARVHHNTIRVKISRNPNKNIVNMFIAAIERDRKKAA